MYDRLQKLYYNRSLTLDKLDVAISKGWITEQQKVEIIQIGQVEV